MNDRPLRVFLCHASEDKDTVRLLFSELASRGIDVWLDEERILPGQNWRMEIEIAVRSTDVFLVCLTRNSITKEGYVQREIKEALDIAQEKPEGTIFIIPVRLEHCDVPRQLQDVQWVDLNLENGEFGVPGFDKLMRSLSSRSINVGAILPDYQPLQPLIELGPVAPSGRTPLFMLISGPSGAGKDSVVNEMIRRGIPFHWVVTATSRPPREDEQDGVDYFFMSEDEFARMIDRDEFIEWAMVYGQYKGIPRQPIRDALASGLDIVMRLDVQGVATMRAVVPEAISVFVRATDEYELLRRIEHRAGGDSAIAPDRLLEIAREELERENEFDYFVVNRDGRLDDAVSVIQAIIHAEHHRIHRRRVKV